MYIDIKTFENRVMHKYILGVGGYFLVGTFLQMGTKCFTEIWESGTFLLLNIYYFVS